MTNNIKLSENTIKIYKNRLNCLYTHFDNKSITLFNEYNKIINYIKNNKKFALATKRNYITAIISHLKSNEFDCNIIGEYEKYHSTLAEIQRENYLDNEKSIKEKKNWVTTEEINNKIYNLQLELIDCVQQNKNNIIELYQNLVILLLYTKLPPLRNDYADVFVYNKSPKNEKNSSQDNILILDKGILLLRNYKTSKTYGEKTINIPDDLINIIKNYIVNIRNIPINNVENIPLLIKIKTNVKMDKNSLTKYINRIFFPKKVSTTILRKVYLSEKYPVIHTYREMNNDAYVMGHNINTAKMIYSKK